jgi:acyl-CoA thioesterase I
MLSLPISSRYGVPSPFANARAAIIAVFAGVFVALAAPKPVFGETLTLVAFGDSLTQGYGLPADQGFVPQLQAYLATAGEDVQVINAGVSGDTTAGGAARIDWTLTDDVDAVIVNLGGNDLLRALPPSETRANMDKIARAITARGLPLLIVAMVAPANYGAEYKAEFDAIYPDLAAQYGADLTQPYFTPMTGGNPDPMAAMAFMQDDAIHPNAEGVAKLVAGHGPAIRALLARARAGQ